MPVCMVGAVILRGPGKEASYFTRTLYLSYMLTNVTSCLVPADLTWRCCDRLRLLRIVQAKDRDVPGVASGH